MVGECIRSSPREPPYTLKEEERDISRHPRRRPRRTLGRQDAVGKAPGAAVLPLLRGRGPPRLPRGSWRPRGGSNPPGVRALPGSIPSQSGARGSGHGGTAGAAGAAGPGGAPVRGAACHRHLGDGAAAVEAPGRRQPPGRLLLAGGGGAAAGAAPAAQAGSGRPPLHLGHLRQGRGPLGGAPLRAGQLLLPGRGGGEPRLSGGPRHLRQGPPRHALGGGRHLRDRARPRRSGLPARPLPHGGGQRPRGSRLRADPGGAAAPEGFAAVVQGPPGSGGGDAEGLVDACQVREDDSGRGQRAVCQVGQERI